MRSRALAVEAAQIGVVTVGSPGSVTLKTQIGASRILDLLSGEQLPRIC
jgi:hydrogenase expression/formation protein HypE